MTERYTQALVAFRSEWFRCAVELITKLKEIDNEQYRKEHTENVSHDVTAASEQDERDAANGISPEKRRLFESLDARLLHTDQLTGENRLELPNELSKIALDTLDDATCDALVVVMYAGRSLGRRAFDPDLFKSCDRYDHDRIDAEFAEWWNYLCMDSEFYSREVMAEKWPLDRYLRTGMRMFRIDER